MPEEADVSKIRAIQVVVISALPMLLIVIGHGRRWLLG